MVDVARLQPFFGHDRHRRIDARMVAAATRIALEDDPVGAPFMAQSLGDFGDAHVVRGGGKKAAIFRFEYQARAMETPRRKQRGPDAALGRQA